MLVSNRVPVLAYLFLTAVIAYYAWIYHLSTRAKENNSNKPFDFALNFTLMPIPSYGLKSARHLKLLVLVTTTAAETGMRHLVRTSWANYSGDSVDVQFLMGNPNDELKKGIEQENREFNDIIVADIIEGYYSLAEKTMAMLLYKTRYYPNAKCLVKADIDNVLVLENYERLCEEVVAPLILGKCDVPRNVKRNVTKWAVPENVYSDEFYPMYCSTGSYILAGKTVPQKLIHAAMDSKFAKSSNFRKLSEDVIFTGILAEEAGIRRLHIYGLSFFEIPEFFCRNGFKTTYSIHLRRDKNPVKHYYKLMKLEGVMCRWWDLYAVKRW